MSQPLDIATKLPPEADRVVVSLNPMAGASSASPRAERLAELLAEAGIRAEILTDLDEVGRLAGAWHAEGRLRALVGVGGDGTAAELVNRTAPGLPVTLLPAGNENLLARYVGIRKAPEQLCRTIAEGRLLRLDAARAGRRLFLVNASCGFDAEVVRLVHARRAEGGRTGHVRSRDYVKPFFRVLRSYRYPEIRVSWEGGEGGGDLVAGEAVVRWLFALNLPCYGGGFRIAPQADGRDGRIDWCTFARGSTWQTLRYAGAVLLRRHRKLAHCHTGRARRLQIASQAEVPYQLDGDPGGLLPVEVEVLPERLTLVVPAPDWVSRDAMYDGLPRPSRD